MITTTTAPVLSGVLVTPPPLIEIRTHNISGDTTIRSRPRHFDNGKLQWRLLVDLPIYSRGIVEHTYLIYGPHLFINNKYKNNPPKTAMLFIFCLVVLTTILENTNCDYPAKRMLLAEDLTTQIQALTIRMTRLEGENCLNL